MIWVSQCSQFSWEFFFLNQSFDIQRTTQNLEITFFWQPWNCLPEPVFLLRPDDGSLRFWEGKSLHRHIGCVSWILKMTVWKMVILCAYVPTVQYAFNTFIFIVFNMYIYIYKYSCVSILNQGHLCFSASVSLLAFSSPSSFTANRVN